jgi:hypothetical protein
VQDREDEDDDARQQRQAAEETVAVPIEAGERCESAADQAHVKHQKDEQGVERQVEVKRLPFAPIPSTPFTGFCLVISHHFPLHSGGSRVRTHVIDEASQADSASRFS